MALKYLNTQGELIGNKPNPRFKNYKELFNNLLKSTDVTTMYPICTVIISYDSTRAITVTKKDDKEYYIKMYDLESYDMTFEEKVGGEDNDYIKLKEVEQNARGDKFAIVYFNDGNFRLRTFDKTTRSSDQIMSEELDINELLGINNYTMAISGFPDPYVTCCFIDDERIFVNLFYNFDLTHYHFIYNAKTQKMQGQFVKMKIDCSKKNFPYKCFFNEEDNEIYSFYRQGQSFIIKLKDVKGEDWGQKFLYDRMTEMDLGQMYIVYNKALIARSSSDILFFKLAEDENTKTQKWKQYKIIEARGFIYYIKGNVRIQITTDDLIYFYLIDPVTFEPILENVMYNYMNCTQMMFGSKVRYCITYKTNQRSFQIYRRKFMHNFKVTVCAENLEGSKGLEFGSSGIFLVTKTNKVMLYSVDTYAPVGTIKIDLLESKEREPNEIIAMQKCQNEEYLAIISGKNLIAAEQKINQLFVYRKIVGSDGNPNFERCGWIKLKDMEYFQQVSMDFHFKNKEGLERNEILFAKIDQVFLLNFKTE